MYNLSHWVVNFLCEVFALTGQNFFLIYKKNNNKKKHTKHLPQFLPAGN